ncbi:MAG: hypothetical protein E4H06_04205 [Methanosarcina sp.]|nr:MAG: hypothetical protein E4H06_04205 [Methanosarcina sp.]
MKRISESTGFQVILLLAAITIVGNLNAVVDYFLHPAIPYFDRGHLIVGGFTAIVLVVLFGILLSHVHSLTSALNTIKLLEESLPMCFNCKKIRRAEANPAEQESWQSIEAYLTENTDSQINHGICPDCTTKLYPQLALKT